MAAPIKDEEPSLEGFDCEAVLRKYVTGHAQDANVFPQLLVLFRAEPDAVVGSFTKMLSTMVENADAGVVALRAGQQLVTAAITVDKQTGGSRIVDAVLQQALVIAGKPGRSSASRSQRTQCCSLLSKLAPEVPSEQQKAVETKLLDFADDRVPSIREKAMKGLAALVGNDEAHEEAQRTLGNRTRDMCTLVRAVAVRSLKLSNRTAALLLARFEDLEGCVRAELFNKLAEQPEAVDDLGPASLLHLITGLKDVAPHVRAAAGVTIQKWCKYLGGVAPLFCRCDVANDEQRAEVAVGALVGLCRKEALAEATKLLDEGFTNSVSSAAEKALLTRWAISTMSEEERDDSISEPVLLEQTRQVLKELATKGGDDFVLRQLLAMIAGMDSTDYQRQQEVQILAKDVLFQAPLPKPGQEGSRRGAFIHTSVDWAMIVLRKNMGCYTRELAASRRKTQQLEGSLSTGIMTLVAEFCKDAMRADGACNDDVKSDVKIEDCEDGNQNVEFISRLSKELEDINTAFADQKQRYEELTELKKKAIREEDYICAHKLKDEAKKFEKDLARLKERCSTIEDKRDGICLRILAITTALLRWTNSNLKRDPALRSILETILKPMMGLQANTGDVEAEVLRAIATYCSIDSDAARRHWSFLILVFQSLVKDDSMEEDDEAVPEERQLSRRRAAIAATALADCARIHGGQGHFNREEVLSAALALANVPFAARDVAVIPLCCWFHTFGHIFFEEHLRLPISELHWSLGWMLVDAFRQRIELDGDGKNMVEELDVEGSAENMGFVMDLHRFFNFLPKTAGKHGAPMLSLAVEAVAEFGLWRAAVLTPKEVPGRTIWTRHFSWPLLFKFAHQRLSSELRYRLWRCALQLCVTYPELAPIAEVPHALIAVASKGEAPPGAGVLVSCAITLGADETILSAVAAQVGETKEATQEEALQVLQERKEGEQREKESLGALEELGVNVASWGVCDVKAPKMTPPGFMLRAPGAKKKKEAPPTTGASSSTAALGTTPAPSSEGSPSHAMDADSAEPVLPCTEAPEEEEEEQESKRSKTGGRSKGRGRGCGRAAKAKAASADTAPQVAKRRKVSILSGGA